MMRLFRWIILRRLAREPLRSATTSLGIALGIAVIIAIQLTNASSLAGFETALTAFAGRASLEIVSPGGVEETRLGDLGWLRDFGQLAPIVEADVTWLDRGAPGGTLRLLGIDVLRDQGFRDYRLTDGAASASPLRSQDFLTLLRDPGSAIVTTSFAAAHGLTPGSTLTIQTGDRAVPLTVRALLADDGPARALGGQILVMDIAAAQQALGRFGRIDRLEIQLRDGLDVDTTEAAIAARLPSGLTIERPSQRGRQVEQMLAAFHLNLTALSYVALVVGLFLVYNTVSIAVVSRREEIGMLRALGVTRGRVRALFLAEAAVLSLVGSALGLVAGRLLAHATVALTATTVSALYVATAAAPPALGWRHVAIAFGIGVPLSLLAAFVPAQEASRVTPMAAIRGADQVEQRRRSPWRSAAVAAALLGAGAWLATLGPVGGLPIFGYASAAAIVFGASFLVPAALGGAMRALAGPVRRWLSIADWIAVSNLSAAVSRLSISVAALAVSLSMMTAIAIMVGSFRQTVIYWVGQTLQADLYISPGSGQAPGRNGVLSPEVVAAIAAEPGVVATDQYRVVEVPYDGTRVRIVGRRTDVMLLHGGLLFKAPVDAAAALRMSAGLDAVAASESFVLKHHAALGDTIDVPTPTGAAPCRLVAVYYDYSSDRGVLIMDRATFDRHFGAGSPNGVSVYLSKDRSADDVRTHLLDTLGRSHRLFITTNQALRADVLRVFDSTFAITSALELVAIVVAMLGVSGTLLTLILEREREFTILRLLGTLRRQVRRAIVGEALILGAVSQAIGLVVGFALSIVLIDVINVQSFGWTIQFHVPIVFLVQSSLAMIAATAIAGLYPARRAMRLATSARWQGEA